MSTNYYVSFRRALAEGVPVEWLHQVHIAQYATGGFLLQAIRGNRRYDTEPIPSNIEGTVQSAFYWSPVPEIDSVENWEQMKAFITNPDFAIIDEYGMEVKVAEFIERVESKENGTDYRYRRMTDWLDEPKNIWFKDRVRTDYLDKDGFSFEIREFS